MKKAKTGDLLLFKANNIGASIIRFFTNSNFDHVAIILKFENEPDEVYYLDSTSSNGVSVNKWSDVVPHYGQKSFY